jgi:hypothetical protein
LDFYLEEGSINGYEEEGRRCGQKAPVTWHLVFGPRKKQPISILSVVEPSGDKTFVIVTVLEAGSLAPCPVPLQSNEAVSTIISFIYSGRSLVHLSFLSTN